MPLRVRLELLDASQDALGGKMKCNEMSLKDDKMLAAGEGGSLPLLKHTFVRGDVGTRIALAVHLLTTQSHTRGEL